MKQKQPTAKQRQRAYRNAQIKYFYESLPDDIRNVRRVAAFFGVSKSTVAYAINGRPKKNNNK